MHTNEYAHHIYITSRVYTPGILYIHTNEMSMHIIYITSRVYTPGILYIHTNEYAHHT